MKVIIDINDDLYYLLVRSNARIWSRTFLVDVDEAIKNGVVIPEGYNAIITCNEDITTEFIE